MSIQNMIARKMQCNYRLNRKVLHMKHCVDEVNSVLDALCAHGHKPKPMPPPKPSRPKPCPPPCFPCCPFCPPPKPPCPNGCVPPKPEQKPPAPPCPGPPPDQNRNQDLLCLHTRAAVSLQSRNQSLLHHPSRDLNRLQALALASLTDRSPGQTFDIPDHAAPAFSFRRFAFNEL